MMGGITNVFILIVCIVFAMIIFVPNASTIKTFSKMQNSTSEIAITQLNLTQDAPIIGTVSFPNVFGIFKGLADMFMTMSGAVGDTFGSMVDLPPWLVAFLILIVATVLVLKVIGFWRGTETS